MRRAFKKHIADKKGFTLAETLVAILILLMVTAIVAAGIPVAANAYEKIVLAGNAQTLLSTTMTRLRDELGTATNITVASSNDGSAINYTGDTGRNSRIYFNSNDTDGIHLTEYADAAQGVEPYDHLLVTEQAATESLYATYGSVTYDSSKGILIVNNLQVKAKKDGRVITETEKVEIWVLTDLT